MNNRREFLKSLGLSSAMLISGEAFSSNDFLKSRKKVVLRFIVASDVHYGQPKTEFEAMTQRFIEQANLIHKTQKVNFCVLNGDLIHDKPEYMSQVKSKFDQLTLPYYVTKGNHDMISDKAWETIWKMPVNHTETIKGNALIFATTSNEKGEYLSPDLDWLKTQLDAAKNHKNTFLFIHIPQAKWTANGIETPAFFDLLKNYPNIKAVFHGHEHDKDGIKIHNNLPYIFDAHIGGNWGTAYRGFRVVEVMKDNSILTYMMNPTERILEATL